MATSSVYAQAYIHEDQMNLLKGDLVKVYVGAKRRRFRIHRDLLASACEILRRKVKPFNSNLGGNPLRVYLTDDEPNAFELFVNWLYRKTLPALDGSSEARAKEQVGHYVTLYLMAESWAIVPLKNLILDTIKARQTCDYGWFPADLIENIYAETPKGSPFRRYIVDSFLFKTSTSVWGKAKRAKALKTQADAGNVEFLLECYEGLFGMAPKFKMRDRDPGTSMRCFYHEHGVGEWCRNA